MNHMRLLIMFICFVLAACEGKRDMEVASPERADHPPVIVASNYPLYFFASEIAGDSFRVVLPEIDGDPAAWKPDAGAIHLLQSAGLVILNGAGYEGWLDWVTLADDRLLDSTATLRDRLIPMTQESVHQHGPEGEHSHKGMAFTTWLDPVLAIGQASAIEQSFALMAPENADLYRSRLAALVSQLEQLDQALREAFSPLQSQPLVFSHPVYQYLASRYGLDGISMHWEPEEDPGTLGWLELQNSLRHHPARLMIWENRPLKATADRLRDSGLAPVVFDTASNRPDSGDYFDVMEENIGRLLLK